MDLDYLAESESDSETEGEGAEGGNGNGAGNANTSNNDNNQSNQNEVFFSDEDTGESSHGEEDESEAGETDEQDGDEFTFGTNVAGAGGKKISILKLCVCLSSLNPGTNVTIPPVFKLMAFL